MSRKDEIREAVKAAKAKARASGVLLVDELQRSLGNVRAMRALRGEGAKPTGGTPKRPRGKPRLRVVK